MRTNTLIKTSHHTSPSQPPLPSRLPVSERKQNRMQLSREPKRKGLKMGTVIREIVQGK